jgi:hypothetical protein
MWEMHKQQLYGSEDNDLDSGFDGRLLMSAFRHCAAIVHHHMLDSLRIEFQDKSSTSPSAGMALRHLQGMPANGMPRCLVLAWLRGQTALSLGWNESFGADVCIWTITYVFARIMATCT